MSAARAIHSYVAAVFGAALLCVGAFSLTDVGEFEHPWLVVVLAVLIALEGATAVKLVKGGGQSETQTHEEAILVFMALAFSPIAALVAVTAGSFVGDVVARRGALKTAFNVASFGGAGALALTAVDLVGGVNEITARRVSAVLLGAVIFATATRTAVAGVLAVAAGTSFRRNLVDDLRPWTLLLLGNASVGLLAGLAAVSHAWTVPFAFAAMLALSFAFSGHARARREGRRLDDLVSSSWDGIFSVDGDGGIQLWNPAMSRLSGIAADDALGREASVVLDLRHANGEAASGFLDPAQPSSGEEDTEVFCLHVEDTTRWLRISRAALPDLGYSFIARDITTERDAEESVRANEERLRLALDAGSMGWWEADLDTGEELWSESLSTMYGLPGGGSDRRYEDFLACIHQDDLDAVAEAVDRAWESGRFALTYRIRRPDGAVRWIEGSGQLIVRDGRTKMIGISRDVTERKEMEESLLHAQKVEAIGALAAGIAHDFNNMLSAVNGFSELTLAALEPDAPVRPFVEQIAGAGKRAAGISAQLLTFSRNETAAPGAIDLEAVVRGIEQLLPSMLPAGVEIVTRVEGGLGTIRGDTGELEQALVNLAVNAGHAMPRGGTLTFEIANVDFSGKDAAEVAAPAESCIRLAVTDTGVGMDETTRRRIFDPFFTTKERGEGTGLGLAMVAATVEQSGGSITVASTPGEGTSFELLFPRLDPAATPAEEASHSLDPSRGTILLVEDSASVRAYERLILEEEGYLVLEAENAADAVEVAARHDGRIDVLVTDVVMPPHSSGPELAQELARTHSDMTVVYISGFSRAETAQYGVHDVDPYLLKPVTPEGLAAAVREVRDAAAEREHHLH